MCLVGRVGIGWEGCWDGGLDIACVGGFNGGIVAVQNRRTVASIFTKGVEIIRGGSSLHALIVVCCRMEKEDYYKEVEREVIVEAAGVARRSGSTWSSGQGGGSRGTPNNPQSLSSICLLRRCRLNSNMTHTRPSEQSYKSSQLLLSNG